MDDMDDLEDDDDLLAEDLEAFLAGEDMPAGEWEISDAGDDVDLQELADRMLYRIRRAEQEIAKTERLYRRRVEPLERWRKDRTEGARGLVERTQASLEAVTRRLVELNPKRKTVNLPNGRVKLTAPGQASLVVDDEPAFLAWLKENHPDQVTAQVEVVEKWDKSQVKKLLAGKEMSDDEQAGAEPGKRLEWAVDQQSGEQVPGVHLERPAADRFSFEL